MDETDSRGADRADPAVSLTFRTATVGDAEAMAVLVNSAYRGESSKAGWTTEADILDGQRTDPDSLRALIARPDQVFLLAFEDGELVGSVNLERFGDRRFLGMLTIKPTAQARGLGRRLIAFAEDRARDEGSPALFMTVISIRTELIAYYERRGYHPTGETKDFPFDNPKFGLPKRRDFNLLVLKKTL